MINLLRESVYRLIIVNFFLIFIQKTEEEIYRI